MPLTVLKPLLARYGVQCSLEVFHSTVNRVFHDVEATVYDEVHHDLWQSLPQQFVLLASDVLKCGPQKPLRLLDIGCGTGLSTDLLLRTSLGPSIDSVHLIDTSPKMLERARNRLSVHPVKLRATNASIAELDNTSQYDVILACSVLHHIPDVSGFLADVRRLQRPGGFFVHLQDPNNDSSASPARRQRRETLENRNRKTEWQGKLHRTVGALARRLTGRTKTYMDRVNDELLAQGVISRPMEPPDIWSVTDIHVFDGKGVSVNEMLKGLPEYRPVSTRSYGFFSVLESELPSDLRVVESALTSAGSLEGNTVAGVWQLC